MKKLTLFAIALVAVMAVHAQTNLLTNPSFETWTNGTSPDGWTLSSSGGTVSQNTTNPYGSTGIALQVAATSTYSVTQNVLPPNGASTFDPSITYELRVRYLATVGDGTDARIWCNFQTGSTPATIKNYYSTPALTADSIGLMGPGGNIYPTPDVYATGKDGYLMSNCPSTPTSSNPYANQWLTYVFKFQFPAGITQFQFQARTYKNATVLWDDFYFGEAVNSDVSTAITSTSTTAVKVFVSGNQLVVKGTAPDAPVMVYNAVGALVKKTMAADNITLPKGMYLVKVEGNATKVIVN
jgi:hypothetical protein